MQAGLLAKLLLEGPESAKDFIKRKKGETGKTVRDFYGFKVMGSAKTLAKNPTELLKAVSFYPNLDPDEATDILREILDRYVLSHLLLSYFEHEDDVNQSGLEISMSYGNRGTAVEAIQFPVTVASFLKKLAELDLKAQLAN